MRVFYFIILGFGGFGFMTYECEQGVNCDGDNPTTTGPGTG